MEADIKQRNDQLDIIIHRRRFLLRRWPSSHSAGTCCPGYALMKIVSCEPISDLLNFGQLLVGKCSDGLHFSPHGITPFTLD
ncbi:unnamed protein product [Nippostrongylus brasiliensis]|uniref:Uncharacterized protein n=1 Tax=Nippostrongylus brasiliensis TaxID=27835 RepID=A0A0N4XM86_NIPBR|nr:unnamed protein product [Nippostrongylus brasiliensis]